MSCSRTFRVWTVLVGVTLAAACGGGDSGGPTAPPTVDPPRATMVMVSPATAELDVGETVQLTAVVRDQNSNVMAGASVTWMSGAGTVATVNASGLVTGVAGGTATITARSGSAQGTAQITVVSVTAPVVSVEVSSPAEPTALGEPLQLGEALQLSAEALDENGRPIPGVEFSWESSNTSVATVDATGLVTAVAAGTATITASAGDVRATVEITVVSATQPVVSVEVSPSAETIAIGTTRQLSAEAFDENGQAVAGAEFSWESDDDAVAMVDGSGLVTGVGEGTATITASSGSAQGTAAITVVSVTQPVASVEVSPSAETIAVGETLQLTAGAVDANGQAVAGAEFSWESDDHAVATVDGSGLVTGVAEGTATITASSGSAQGTAAITVANAVASSDRGILEAFYHATGGPNWGNSDNWMTGAPLGDWHGVRADASGRVVGLDLAYNDLTGPIPAELGNLANLAWLDLNGNELTGPIPAELGNLANLVALYIGGLGVGGNELTGPIPAELGNLANLEGLNLADNELTGPIPAELGNLANLDGLNLGGNELTGPIPAELGNLANLAWLFLGGNELTGPIPAELGNLANLEWLDLAHNELTGPIPAELGNLANLAWGLNLGGNELTGPIPAELGNLANLETLDLADNELTGPIPQSFLQLDSLLVFHFGDNASLCAPSTPAFVTWLANITHSGPVCTG